MNPEHKDHDGDVDKRLRLLVSEQLQTHSRWQHAEHYELKTNVDESEENDCVNHVRHTKMSSAMIMIATT